MEAVNDAEKNAQAQINKALEAAKVPRPSAKHLLTLLTTSSWFTTCLQHSPIQS